MIAQSRLSFLLYDTITFGSAIRRTASVVIPDLNPQAIEEFMAQESRPQVFSNGSLNVVESMLPRRCISFLFRGNDELYSLEEAVELLKHRSSDGMVLRIGVQFAEDPSMFLPVRIREGGNVYHMYHFVEHIVMAFAALTKLRSLSDANTTWSNATSISVPWLFAAHASRREFCGGPTNINCLIADLVFWSSQTSVFQKHLGIIGLDAMDHYDSDPSNPKEKGIPYRIDIARNFYQNERRFDLADGVVKIERFGCNNGGINKPWHVFIDDFPSELWHSTIRARLELDRSQSGAKVIDSYSQLLVCYIDRQNTDRKLPDEHHKWLVHTFSRHPSVLFLPLRMENYSAIQQVEQASRCDMMMGMHGNGLTHVLWMKPGSSGNVRPIARRCQFESYLTKFGTFGKQSLSFSGGITTNMITLRQHSY